MRTLIRRALGPLAAGLMLLSGGSAVAATPWLHVSGNRIVDAGGAPVTLRGVSIIAPEEASDCGDCNPKPSPAIIDMTADAAQGWYARVVRIPITTRHETDPATSFASYIDPAVRRASADGLYAIVDLHYVSDYAVNGSKGVSQAYLLKFWSYVAARYADSPNVIFEVFNEPMNPNDWATWKAYIQPVIDLIRARAPRNLILVGSPNWSTRVNEAAADPLVGTNLVYVFHIYPNSGPATAANLDQRFGFAAQRIPIMITEFGWNPPGKSSTDVAAGTTAAWGVPFRQYLDQHPEVSWTSWIFDNAWKPTYFDSDWNLLGGDHQGQFMKQWLADKKDSDQPH